MKAITIFRYEFNHFRKNKAKVFAFLLFVMACTYALYNGVMLQKKQTETIRNIEELANESQTKTLAWFDEGKKGPEDRPWIDVTTPFWALWNTPTYTIKAPSPLLPLGIGQAEQYGYYKQVTNWSSTYDNDMVEEMANPERLVNGNIDFSFLLLYLLPLLFIILTYNIYGLERDLNFDKLVHVQTGNTSKWIIARLGFYTILLLFTILLFITATALINGVFDEHGTQLMSLILLSTVYILVWAVSFYFIIRKSNGSSSIAFKMISVWLIFCVLIPGAVNQLSSMKYPANYMTDYLDANRKEAYEVFELENDSLSDLIMDVYPGLSETLYGQDSLLDEEIVGNTVSVLINQINKKAIEKIEQQNEAKNKLITSSYWYNPVTFFQNKWNSITSTDYYAYKAYRTKVQETIDKKIKLLVFECWNRKKVDKATYENYSILLR